MVVIRESSGCRRVRDKLATTALLLADCSSLSRPAAQFQGYDSFRELTNHVGANMYISIF